MTTDSDLATTLGDIADGVAVTEEERQAARRAVSARGGRWFVSVHIAHQDNVDTAELFFEHTATVDLDLRDEDTAFRHGVVPLDVLLDTAAWERAATRWGDSDDSAQWEAFVKRVARPLVHALDLG